jgi:hypothetical protein
MPYILETFIVICSPGRLTHAFGWVRPLLSRLFKILEAGDGANDEKSE